MPWDNAALAEANGVAPETPIEPDYAPRPPQAEPYDAREHGVPQPPQRQEPPIPDVEEDPIAHYNARLAKIEDHGARHNFWDGIRNAEANARNELGEDYDEACQHLEAGRIAELQQQFPDNSRQAHLLAHSYGLPDAAHLRAAILNRDRMVIADHAVRNGIDPAAAYYQFAQERGYRPAVAITKTQRKRLSNAIAQANDTGDYNAFDQLWGAYEKVAKREDELARGRR
jgi:hypothetical protein